MNADGSDPVNLTKGRHCASPAWSPDGTKIAYIGDVFDDDQYGGEIWLMDADGGNPQQLTDDSVDRTRLSWSEDGRSIYYTVRTTDGPRNSLVRLFWRWTEVAPRPWTTGERCLSTVAPVVPRMEPKKQSSCCRNKGTKRVMSASMSEMRVKTNLSPDLLTSIQVFSCLTCPPREMRPTRQCQLVLLGRPIA